MMEYMYTDGLKGLDPDQAEEMFDIASRYLLFPLKRTVADVLLPHLETGSHAELCHGLILSDMHNCSFTIPFCRFTTSHCDRKIWVVGVSVVKIREYCLDLIACNFETFAEQENSEQCSLHSLRFQGIPHYAPPGQMLQDLEATPTKVIFLTIERNGLRQKRLSLTREMRVQLCLTRGLRCCCL